MCDHALVFYCQHIIGWRQQTLFDQAPEGDCASWALGCFANARLGCWLLLLPGLRVSE